MSSNKKVRIFKGYWTIDDIRKHNNCLFIYGDNNVGIGKAGQAIIRDEPNTIGIPTKKYPSNNPNSFYSDLEFEDNIERINNAINQIITKSSMYKYVILPADGFGTGLARLPFKAPKTYKYLVDAIENMCSKL